ncbi:class I SAM-dependent methyltransferase [Shewanella maritima]|uniref:Class I SAM-dependent methyltransferase n=1 Tax=Shewanella maritima TaxID=2520507 RepID=A0A411PF14_9GAMM|nr:class I SAM-dependent methyltransferase [Shewanella maritima]QBF81992.1 class I SAM-dependent methyltransferase [Shewanella maritima]
MSTPSSQFYNQNAAELAEQYQSKSFMQVHSDWAHLLPGLFKSPDKLTKHELAVLDVGAGSGRDIGYLAAQAKIHLSESHSSQYFVAVEPAAELRRLGQANTQELSVNWLDDAMPKLTAIKALDKQFDLILLSAVWMHFEPQHRAEAMASLTSLLKPQGLLVMSLRHGQTEQELRSRAMHHVEASEVLALANNNLLSTMLVTDLNQDQLGRSHVQWQTVVLQRGA